MQDSAALAFITKVDISRIRRGDIIHLAARVSGNGVMGGNEPKVAVTLSGAGEYVVPARAIIAHEEALEVGARVCWGLGEGEIIAVRGDWAVVAADGNDRPVSFLRSALRGID